MPRWQISKLKNTTKVGILENEHSENLSERVVRNELLFTFSQAFQQKFYNEFCQVLVA